MTLLAVFVGKPFLLLAIGNRAEESLPSVNDLDCQRTKLNIFDINTVLTEDSFELFSDSDG